MQSREQFEGDLGNEPEVPDTWKWKRVRNISIGVEFWPLQWGFGIDRDADFFGGKTSLGFGPFVFYIQYNSCTGLFGRAECNVPV